MKSHRSFPFALALALLCPASLSFGAPSKAAKPSPQGAKPPATSSAVASAPMEIPQSVFIIPATPKEGRNPFFPRSTTGFDVPKPKATPTVATVDSSSLVLNGITPQPTPTVMINSVTFEKGEEHDIKLANGGKLRVKCEEIRADSALILVNGSQQRELRMKGSL